MNRVNSDTTNLLHSSLVFANCYKKLLSTYCPKASTSSSPSSSLSPSVLLHITLITPQQRDSLVFSDMPMQAQSAWLVALTACQMHNTHTHTHHLRAGVMEDSGLRPANPLPYSNQPTTTTNLYPLHPLHLTTHASKSAPRQFAAVLLSRCLALFVSPSLSLCY